MNFLLWGLGYGRVFFVLYFMDLYVDYLIGRWVRMSVRGYFDMKGI